MFAGNIGDAQDFPAILAAADQLKSNTAIRWLILGEGRASNWVNSEIKRRNLEDCFLMLGRYPLDRMPSFFKHADVLLVSLKPEPIFAMTIPGKLQSYLAAGVPIVAMLNGEGADIVKNSKAGLSCDAGDHKALAAAVLRISQMTGAERELMGSNGKNYSADQFDRKLLIDRLDE
ncbi:MAG: glycosyltransferase family 4 protein [Giesbergeria sp.]